VNPRRTHLSDSVFRLPGVWVPSDEERQAIADGANVELIVYGAGHPPVSMRLDETPLGKAPAVEQG
jgi:hypothetical protein